MKLFELGQSGNHGTDHSDTVQRGSPAIIAICIWTCIGAMSPQYLSYAARSSAVNRLPYYRNLLNIYLTSFQGLTWKHFEICQPWHWYPCPAGFLDGKAFRLLLRRRSDDLLRVCPMFIVPLQHLTVTELPCWHIWQLHVPYWQSSKSINGYAVFWRFTVSLFRGSSGIQVLDTLSVLYRVSLCAWRRSHWTETFDLTICLRILSYNVTTQSLAERSVMRYQWNGLSVVSQARSTSTKEGKGLVNYILLCFRF